MDLELLQASKEEFILPVLIRNVDLNTSSLVEYDVNAVLLCSTHL